MRTQRPQLAPLTRQDPDRIGVFTPIGRLGVGAMGRVYLARSAAGRLVAVKTIRPEYADEADFRARFALEVAAARKVSGVFTAAVVAADPDAALPWLATAYVPAPALDVLVHTCGPLPTAAVRWLAAGCAEALESIHAAGLVHRDLKPSNVMVAPDGPRVIDFGVARATERVALTTTRGSVGTPAYMAPEQARDTRRADSASDVFALGATLLFAASGRAPYHGETVIDVLVRQATEPPDLSGAPPELVDLFTACLAREPADRPSPAALLAWVAPYLEGSHDAGFAASLPERAAELIEDYRDGPAPAPDRVDTDDPAEAAPGGPEATFGSLAGRARRLGLPIPLPRGWAAGDPVRPDDVDTKPGGGTGPFGRLTMVVAVVGLLLALTVGAALVGRWTADASNGPPTDQGQGQDGPGGYGPPPPGGGPRPPLSGASDTPDLPRSIELNQPQGDRHTNIVVHGRGWKPGCSVTISLSGRKSPDRVVVDRAGTFNYSVNQSWEFFEGPIPTGDYTVTAVSDNGLTAKASFTIHP